jgi:hypothetical protein
LVLVNLQLKPVQRFYRVIPRNVLFGIAMIPILWLLFALLGIWFPSATLTGITGLLLMLSLIFPLLVIVRQALRPFLRRPERRPFIKNPQ